MQTNNLYSCQAEQHSERLLIYAANGERAAVIYAPGQTDTFILLRPVELRWLAYAAENFDKFHALALAAGGSRPLMILPDEPA